MDDGAPSRTALGAAMHRAAHQTLEQGTTFADPFALPIIGAGARGKVAEWSRNPYRKAMRLFIAARHRLADDKLAVALGNGVTQVVVVGAGLDTTALRHADALPGVHFFEVDHPATQAWKRRRLDEEDLDIPAALTFVPVNFERQGLVQGLTGTGFDATAPAFFIWLGVVPYLTEAAIVATLGFVASVPGAELVFDYANPAAQLGPKLRAAHDRGAARVAALGEPWISAFDSAALALRLQAMGVVELEDFGPAEIQRFIFGIGDPVYTGAGGHILWARWP